MELHPNLIVGLALLAGLVAGGFAVHLLHRRAAGNDRERAEQLSRELGETREELQGYREEVVGHFSGASDLFRDLTEQYTRLYAHLAEGARGLCRDEAPALGREFGGPLLSGGAEATPEPPASAAPATNGGQHPEA